MLDNLTTRLARVMKTLKGEARLTETNIADALREVRMALLEADVALPVVKDFVAAVKEKAVRPGGDWFAESRAGADWRRACRTDQDHG